ncbi:SPOR domain-containing protein [Oxalobacteraceae bacterium]|nr:SPOR domain-containing protein [Oxalobacteraceae bacterium]
MLKLIFWSLLAVNGALFAYGQGYLGHFSGSEHEPERLQGQLNAEQLRIVSPARASASAPAAASAQASAAAASAPSAAAAAASTAASAPVAASAPAPAKPVVKAVEALACYEIGNFALADARRFETQLQPLDLGERQARRQQPGTEISSYIVFIPPQGSKEGAEKKASELRQLDVSNYFIMPDPPAMRWAISLGVFKTEAAAQSLLASLVKQGVHSAKVAPRMSGGKLASFQFRDVDAALKNRLDKLRGAYPGIEARNCK